MIDESTSKGARKRVLIAEDHPVVVAGLAAAIAMEGDFEVCGTTDNAAEALALVGAGGPDAAIVDLGLRDSDGLELIRRARQDGHRLPLVVLSSRDRAVDAERALAAGASGYVTKSEDLSHVVAALRWALAGEVYVSDELRAASRPEPPDAGLETLSARERQVFRRIGRGLGSRRIATELGISVSTVESHHRNVRRKLGVSCARDLVRRAVRWCAEHERLAMSA